MSFQELNLNYPMNPPAFEYVWGCVDGDNSSRINFYYNPVQNDYKIKINSTDTYPLVMYDDIDEIRAMQARLAMSGIQLYSSESRVISGVEIYRYDNIITYIGCLSTVSSMIGCVVVYIPIEYAESQCNKGSIRMRFAHRGNSEDTVAYIDCPFLIIYLMLTNEQFKQEILKRLSFKIRFYGKSKYTAEVSALGGIKSLK